MLSIVSNLERNFRLCSMGVETAVATLEAMRTQIVSAPLCQIQWTALHSRLAI